MKILHFITSLKVGGAEIALCNLLERWHTCKDSNEHVVAYIHPGPCCERIKKLGIKMYRVKPISSPVASFLSFARVIKEVKPDIIHSALWSANVIAGLCAKYCKIKPGGGAIPLVCDLHGDCRRHGRLRKYINAVLYKVLRKKLPQFVAVSHSVKKSFCEVYRSTGSKPTVIQNGIDADVYTASETKQMFLENDQQVKSSHFVLGAVGRLHPIKRFDFLIKSFARFLKMVPEAKAKLCIVGDGKERESLERLVDELGIRESVFFAGYQKEPTRFYSSFDCFVLPSRSEGLSIALLEALCFGLPVVTTSEDGTHDVITDGVNGFLIPATRRWNTHVWDHSTKSNFDDENYLASIFERLYKNSGERVSIGKVNYKLVREKFKISHTANQYKNLYSNVLNFF